MHPGDTDRVDSGGDRDRDPAATPETDTTGERTDGGTVSGTAARDTDATRTFESLPGSDAGVQPEGNLPYIFARRTVKADREALPVYVSRETRAGVEELERELATQFEGDDVMALDVREALVAAGLRNTEDVVATLEAWGYGRR